MLWPLVVVVLGAAARLECGMGWGQFNGDNMRLRVEKTWTRICLSYCFVLHSNDAWKMEKLVGGEWVRLLSRCRGDSCNRASRSSTSASESRAAEASSARRFTIETSPRARAER